MCDSPTTGHTVVSASPARFQLVEHPAHTMDPDAVQRWVGVLRSELGAFQWAREWVAEAERIVSRPQA